MTDQNLGNPEDPWGDMDLSHSLEISEKTVHHTLQALAGAMGWPGLQPNAFWNSGMFCTTPFTRQRPGE
jgi:hypothetical protein